MFQLCYLYFGWGDSNHEVSTLLLLFQLWEFWPWDFNFAIMLIMNRLCIHSIVLGGLKTWKKNDIYKIWSQLGSFYAWKTTVLESKLVALQDNLRKMKDSGWRLIGVMTEQFKNPLPSTIKNPTEILVAENPMAPTKEFHEKTKLT